MQLAEKWTASSQAWAPWWTASLTPVSSASLRATKLPNELH